MTHIKFTMEGLSYEDVILCNQLITKRNAAIHKQRDNALFMATQKFDYGDIVIVKKANPLMKNLGIPTGQVGVIVGHFHLEGLESDKFRVYFNDDSNQVGVDSDNLELYNEEYSFNFNEGFGNVTWNNLPPLIIEQEEI